LAAACALINRYAKVSALRDAELGAAWAGMLVSIANTVVTRSATLVITLLTFAVYVRGARGPRGKTNHHHLPGIMVSRVGGHVNNTHQMLSTASSGAAGCGVCRRSAPHPCTTVHCAYVNKRYTWFPNGGQPLNSATAFSALALINILGRPMQVWFAIGRV